MKTKAPRGKGKTVLFSESTNGDAAGYAENTPFGGWIPNETRFVPLRFSDLVRSDDHPDSATNYALDCITLSNEAGVFTDTKSFLVGAFATPNDFSAFCEQVRDYPNWLNERHFYAFMDLLNCDEEGMRSYEELADALEEAIQEQ